MIFKSKKNAVTKVGIFLMIMGSQTVFGGGFSIGIPGVISIGGDGGLIKVGPSAQGTNIPTPNCGGAICDALENGKNAITGENEKKRAQEEYDQKVNELTNLRQELINKNNQIEEIRNSMSLNQANFQDFKKNLKESLKSVNTDIINLTNSNHLTNQLILESINSVDALKKQASLLIKASKVAYNKLLKVYENSDHSKTDHDMHAFAVTTEQIIASSSLVGDQAEFIKLFSSVEFNPEEMLKHSMETIEKIGAGEGSESLINVLEKINYTIKSRVSSSHKEIPEALRVIQYNINNLDNSLN